MWLLNFLVAISLICIGNSEEFKRQERCNLPMDFGGCGQRHIRWFYFPNDKKCLIFTYGGCKGNANNFRTFDQCQSACMTPATPEMCHIRPDPGSCRKKLRRWYYDGVENKCFRFTYGGCEGNKNNFRSSRHCLRSCRSHAYLARPWKINICNLRRIRGPCKGNYTRWYFDKQEQACKAFTYGGCIGNENNFLTLQNCQKMCGLELLSESSDSNKCMLPAKKGPCLGNLIRWFYHKGFKKCEPFVYGGCKGNGNRFHSYRKCEASCNKN